MGLLIYKIAPIKKKRYVFTSFNGHYSDNTKYISIKLHETLPDAEIIWLVLPEYAKNVPDYAKAVDINSLKSYWYRGTATAQIDNVYGFRANFKMTEGTDRKLKFMAFLQNKKKQPVIATMHGTPIKKLGRDQNGNTVFGMICPNTSMIVGDKLSAEVFRRITFETMPVDVIGWPRNDVLFAEDNGIREELGLPVDKKILLFAPTFRNDGKDTEGKNVHRSGLNQLAEMDFDKLFGAMSAKFGGEWVMVCRFHYHVANMVDWNDLESRYPGKFINGNRDDDMANYLRCADVLLSDSSSCLCDFSLTNKPCFVYFPDYDNYKNKERGFYIDMESSPYPLAVDFDTLVENIDKYDEGEYVKKLNGFLDEIGAPRDAKASERAVDYILKKCKK